MSILEILQKFRDWGPVFFGIGFLAPLVSQSLQAAGLTAPLGLGTLQLGLIVGVTLGFTAKLRRGWL